MYIFEYDVFIWYQFYIYIYIYGSQIFSSSMEDFPQFGDKREKIHYSATIYLSLFTYYYSSVTDEY